MRLFNRASTLTPEQLRDSAIDYVDAAALHAWLDWRSAHPGVVIENGELVVSIKFDTYTYRMSTKGL